VSLAHLRCLWRCGDPVSFRPYPYPLILIFTTSSRVTRSSRRGGAGWCCAGSGGPSRACRDPPCRGRCDHERRPSCISAL